MEINAKIRDAQTEKSKWEQACDNPDVLAAIKKDEAFAKGMVEFYEGRFDILMDILNEGANTLTQKVIKIRQYEVDTKISTWTKNCSDSNALTASGKTAEEAVGMVKYFEGKKSVLDELEKEL